MEVTYTFATGLVLFLNILCKNYLHKNMTVFRVLKVDDRLEFCLDALIVLSSSHTKHKAVRGKLLFFTMFIDLFLKAFN